MEALTSPSTSIMNDNPRSRNMSMKDELDTLPDQTAQHMAKQKSNDVTYRSRIEGAADL